LGNASNLYPKAGRIAKNNGIDLRIKIHFYNLGDPVNLNCYKSRSCKLQVSAACSLLDRLLQGTGIPIIDN
jgi:hypothetical protein